MLIGVWTRREVRYVTGQVQLVVVGLDRVGVDRHVPSGFGREPNDSSVA
jgi:hypothetical protein